jgi:hypothetical protein
MNKRIQELESQAWGQVNRTNGLVRTEDFNEKFAELLIKECATIADKNSPLSYPDHGIKIKRHFGVEE